MPLLYLLRQPIGVDDRDTDGHTSLMWAAWQGDALSIDLLLKHGASLNARDAAQLTPLHWAAVKGSRACISRLLRAGAALDAKEDNGKTPADMAAELKAIGPWRGALEDAGFDDLGRKRIPAMSEANQNKLIWLSPVLSFGLSFSAFARFPVYCGIPVAIAIFFVQHHLITKTLLKTRGFGDGVTKSPYFAAIIAGSFFHVALCWIVLLLRGNWSFNRYDVSHSPRAHQLILLCR
ncbi:hypothetical protein FFLO_04137 [Filobasidium floriforme]|uniref:protein S-acyltransferase n=1 Tax=Filobasidium floriforme TaxID=5210 RepID=A0A8K0NQ60_9TREE|nr:ankyrin repeat-containing domain protein [Filobasidium floriforme]KAG7531768.1 hypothetical protein FFLO_04137 [Filobasidium floriforme]KAH8089828.1 ankyrin repeat-containing domain protein [Filobasidium floriforme]